MAYNYGPVFIKIQQRNRVQELLSAANIMFLCLLQLSTFYQNFYLIVLVATDMQPRTDRDAAKHTQTYKQTCIRTQTMPVSVLKMLAVRGVVECFAVGTTVVVR